MYWLGIWSSDACFYKFLDLPNFNWKAKLKFGDSTDKKMEIIMENIYQEEEHYFIALKKLVRSRVSVINLLCFVS
jgi:hypothetical protein